MVLHAQRVAVWPLLHVYGFEVWGQKMRVRLDGWPPSQALPDCHPFLQGAHLEGDGLAVVDGVVVLDEHREHVLRPTLEADVIHHEYLLFGLGLRVQKAM